MKTACLTPRPESNITLPSQQKCLDLFKEYKVPKIIFSHCLMVQKVAVFLAEKCLESGNRIDIELVEKAAMLHDLFKMVSISNLGESKFHKNDFSSEEVEMWKSLRDKYPNMHENDVSYLFFKENYPELAMALRNISNPFEEERTFEEELVHYADARVLRNEVVTLKQRFDYLKEAYPYMGNDYWETQIKKISDFESKLMNKIKFNPEKLVEALQQQEK